MNDKLAKSTIESITSCFENGTAHIQYDYIEALGDGRGYTAGKAGFTTGTGDLLDVIQLYLKDHAHAGLSILLPLLKKYAKEESGSIKGLEKLPSIWRYLSKRPDFKAAQDAETDKLYFDPAMALIDKHGLKSNLAKAIFYDTIIQHGDGDDPDSIGAILKDTYTNDTEPEVLKSFLNVRKGVLLSPFDKDSTKEWRGSVDRVNALRRLLDSGNLELKRPFKVVVFGDTYDFI